MTSLKNLLRSFVRYLRLFCVAARLAGIPIKSATFERFQYVHLSNNFTMGGDNDNARPILSKTSGWTDVYLCGCLSTWTRPCWL